MNASPQRPSAVGFGQTQAMGGPAPAPGQDFWDVRGVDQAGGAPVQEFSDVVQLDGGRAQSGKGALYVALFLVAAVVGWFAYETFVNQEDPVAIVGDLVASLLDGGSDVPDVESEIEDSAEETAVVPEAAPAEAVADLAQEPLVGNPYWILPNAILGTKLPMARPWAPEEEEVFRAGLAHQFTYQRYRTVMEIRARRLFGSDAVLWDALQDRKFWTRMFAAIGLAEFNVEVSLSTFEGALTGARSELIADFFERFQKNPTPAHLFVMRQVVRLLDEKGRLVVLNAINKSDDALRDLYLTAASQDPGPRVQAWVAKALSRRPIDPERQSELLAVVEGRSDGQYLITGKPSAAASAAAAAPTTVPSVASEEDLERELEQFEQSAGDIEFYEPVDEPAVSDEEDPETFEYDEYDNFEE